MKILNIEQLKKAVQGIGVNYNLVFKDGSVLDMTLGSLDDINAEMILSKVPFNKALQIDACECGEPKAFGFDYCQGCCDQNV